MLKKNRVNALIIIVVLIAIALVAFLVLGTMSAPKKYGVCWPTENRPTADMPTLIPLVDEILQKTQIDYEYRYVPFEEYWIHLLDTRKCDILLDIERTDYREGICAFSEQLDGEFYFGFRKEDTWIKDKVNEAIRQVKS